MSVVDVCCQKQHLSSCYSSTRHLLPTSKPILRRILSLDTVDSYRSTNLVQHERHNDSTAHAQTNTDLLPAELKIESSFHSVIQSNQSSAIFEQQNATKLIKVDKDTAIRNTPRLPNECRTLYCLTTFPGLVDLLRQKTPHIRVICCQQNDGAIKDNLTPDDIHLLSNAQILVCDPALIVRYNLLPPALPNLKLMLSTRAGQDQLLKCLDTSNLPEYKLARIGGRVGKQMAEYVLAQMIAHERKFDQENMNKSKRIWHQNMQLKTLSELRLGLLGVGHIGKEIARAASFFGMEVWGLATKLPAPETRCSAIAEYRTTEQIDELLENCDYICNVLPSTKNTAGLLNGEVLKACTGRGSVFINVGRGDIISTQTIITALNNSWISHAVLDVHEHEPLPRDSPIWDHPHITLTAHNAAIPRPWMICDSIIENYENFLAGRELNNLLDWKKGY